MKSFTLTAQARMIDGHLAYTYNGTVPLHCHVLVHASMGMSMMVNYAGITSPFETGGRSGNVPE